MFRRDIGTLDQAARERKFASAIPEMMGSRHSPHSRTKAAFFLLGQPSRIIDDGRDNASISPRIFAAAVIERLSLSLLGRVNDIRPIG